MTDIASLISRLIAAGTPGELVGEVAAALASQSVTQASPADEVVRPGTLRMRRLRERRAVDSVTGDADVTPSPSPPSPPQKETPPPAPPLKKKHTPSSDPTLFGAIGDESARKSPRDFLESVLDVKHAAAVIDHRQRLRKPLTPHAADLLARKLGQCSDPNGAADLMIEKGWQSIEPDWWENRQQARAGPGGRRMTAAEQTRENLKDRINDLQQRRGSNGEGGGHLRLAGRLPSTNGKAD